MVGSKLVGSFNTFEKTVTTKLFLQRRFFSPIFISTTKYLKQK